MPLLAIMVYAQLHRHYHAYSKSSGLYQLTGILYSALSGLSWTLYRSHHGNHHRFNNASGDWSKTTDESGKPIPGFKYLIREAFRPFILQLIPFLSLLGMRSSKRTAWAFADEALRVGLRLGTFLLYGPSGLWALLLWQLIFLIAIIYLNYLQHFSVDGGFATFWPNLLFNRLTSQLGYHDQHHAWPGHSERHLMGIAPRRGSRRVIGLFDPIAFVFFLVDHRALAKQLRIHADE